MKAFLTGADEVMRIELSDDGVRPQEIQICSGSLLQRLDHYPQLDEGIFDLCW